MPSVLQQQQARGQVKAKRRNYNKMGWAHEMCCFSRWCNLMVSRKAFFLITSKWKKWWKVIFKFTESRKVCVIAKLLLNFLPQMRNLFSLKLRPSVEFRGFLIRKIDGKNQVLKATFREDLQLSICLFHLEKFEWVLN